MANKSSLSRIKSNLASAVFAGLLLSSGVARAQNEVLLLKINLPTPFFDYDSIKTWLYDRNRDKKVDEIHYRCYLPEGKKIRGEAYDKDFNGNFENGKYLSSDKNSAEEMGWMALNLISKISLNYSEGQYNFKKN